MKISQSEEKIIKQVDEIKNIRVDPSLYNFDIFYQLSLPTQIYDNRYVDEKLNKQHSIPSLQQCTSPVVLVI